MDERALFALLGSAALWLGIACGATEQAPLRAATPANARNSVPSHVDAHHRQTGDDGLLEPRAMAHPSTRTESGARHVGFPTECGKSGQPLCVPPERFVAWLCDGYHPDLALALFAKESPWTRAYMRTKVEAWNATRGATEKIHLDLDEEVLILRHHAPNAGGMIVSGATGAYDALRWDGSCVSLDGGELSKHAPPKAKHPAIPWKRLNQAMQDALLQNKRVLDAYRARRRECQGISMGAVSKPCEKAEHALSRAVVRYVRDGGPLPRPDVVDR